MDGGMGMTYLRQDPSVAGQLARRYVELQDLKKKVDTELAAVENGLRMAGLLAGAGRPRLAPTHTVAEAREAHRRFAAGERDEAWVLDGERQYQRERKAAQKGAA